MIRLFSVGEEDSGFGEVASGAVTINDCDLLWSGSQEFDDGVGDSLGKFAFLFNRSAFNQIYRYYWHGSIHLGFGMV